MSMFIYGSAALLRNLESQVFTVFKRTVYVRSNFKLFVRQGDCCSKAGSHKSNLLKQLHSRRKCASADNNDSTMVKVVNRAHFVLYMKPANPIFSRLSSGLCLALARHWCLKYAFNPLHTLSATAVEDFTHIEHRSHTKPELLNDHTNPIVWIIWFVWEAFQVIVRVVRLFIMFVPLLCLYPLTCIFSYLRQMWWQLMLWAVEAAGPVYMKFGQWASTRRDIFSQEFCDQFCKLQRSVRPHSWYFTCKRLDAAFGKDWRQLLVKFDNDRKPIGSGCVAQVYQAYLRADRLPKHSSGILGTSNISSSWDNMKRRIFEKLEVIGLWKLVGSHDHRLDKIFADYNSHRKETLEKLTPKEKSELEKNSLEVFGITNTDDANLIPVAVKVLHPGIHTAFRRDLFIMKTCVWLIEMLIPGMHWLNFSKCLQEFSVVMEKQIDLSMEANNLEVFAQNFSSMSSIKFPQPIRPFVTQHILVETFEIGTPALLLTTDKYSEEVKGKIAEIGVDAVLKMIFFDNYVHGDLHPGNILVQNADKFDKQPKLRTTDLMDTVILSVKQPPPLRLVFLDCGITASLADKDANNLLNVFAAVVSGNGKEVADLFLKHSRDQRCKDPDGFRQDMSKIVDEFLAAQKNREGINVSSIITQLFSSLIWHKVQLEGNFAIVILSMMIIEGLGHTLKPSLDIIEKIRPFILEKHKEEIKQLEHPF